MPRCSRRSSRSTRSISTSTATSRRTCATPTGPPPRATGDWRDARAPGRAGAGQRERVPARGAARLRRQPARSGQRDDPDARRLLEPRPRIHARPVRPREAGGQPARIPPCWCATRAIGTDQDRKFVLVVGPGNTVEYRPVQLGRLIEGLRIVRSGIKPGERVVVNGLQRVRPGMQGDRRRPSPWCPTPATGSGVAQDSAGATVAEH